MADRKRSFVPISLFAVSLSVLFAMSRSTAFGASLLSDLDGLALSASSDYWNGSDLSGRFSSSEAVFSNSYNTAWMSWAGFAYSRVNDTNTSGYGNQYAVWTPGAGRGGTGIYAVVYDDGFGESDVIAFPFPVCVNGFFVNNTAYTALSMRDGDAFAKKFGGAAGDDPDWFKLTVTGRDGQGTAVGTVDFFLADYRFADNAQDYIVGDWTWVDLTSLGANVRSLHFALSSSDMGAWGMNTPAFFALDDLQFVPRPALLSADIDGLPLGGGAYWNGSDGSGGFFSEWVGFRNDYNASWGTWAGIAYSAVNDTNTAGYANQYAVWTPGTGLGGTGLYAVVYDDPWAESDIVTFPYPASVNGFYVNNATYTALSMRDGDAFAKQFGGSTGSDPDWFKLTVSGRGVDGALLGEKAFYLADYRFANNAQDYIVGEWTWVDLGALGPGVKTLHFALSSSDVGAWGMNTPAFFCLDGLQFCYSFGGPEDSTSLFDPAVPGFVGPDGDGLAGGTNYVNRAFAGWAAQAVDYSPVPGVEAQWTNAVKALGPVTGDRGDIVSLGDLDASALASNASPGSITFLMSTPIADEDGPDFAVFENAFPVDDLIFGELGYVEVSSDGSTFARFPCASLTTNAVGALGNIAAENVYNLCGKHVNAYNTSWGTPFDLAELAASPEAGSGAVDLSRITHVRIVDIPGSGDFFDDFIPSNAIYDAWVTVGSGGVDVEAVGVLNSPDYARVALDARGPGSIAPYGMPGPAVAVAHGSNITFSIVPDPGRHIVDVAVNGVSVGPTNSYTFVNVLEDQVLSAVFGSRLIVRSPFGTSTPAAGTHYAYGEVSVSLSGSPVTAGMTQFVCMGWAGLGSVPASGVTTDTGAFELTNDSELAWVWHTNYWLETDAGYGGSVLPGDGWQAAGSTALCTAAADPYFVFSGWSGDTAGDTNAAAMPLTMSRPRQVKANFWAELVTNGLPAGWLAAHGLTNQALQLEAGLDLDNDGLTAWQEFYAGTDPNNATSCFRIVETGLAGGSNYVVWLGGTNGSALPFAVLCSSNLCAGWRTLQGAIGRAASGTNTWWSPAPADAVYYRIEVQGSGE